MAYNKANKSNAKSIEDADLEKVSGGGSTKIDWDSKDNTLNVNIKLTPEDIQRIINQEKPVTGKELAEILGLSPDAYNAMVKSFGGGKLPPAE